MQMDYTEFIRSKARVIEDCGFAMPDGYDYLYPFQRSLVEFACKRGRSALYCDCGLGKTPMQLSWADAVVNHAGPVLILTPLAVSEQTKREADKFGIEAYHSREGDISDRITITNYERLHKYKPGYFSGIVLDESSILKNYAGKYRQAITDFMQGIPYRLLCTATPAPNDHMELGTSSEALGIMKRKEMLSVFFTHDSGDTNKWILSGHAKDPFWEFMAQWSRAVRKPSDCGDYDDTEFSLPDMRMVQHTLPSKPVGDRLFAVEAVTLAEQRAERRATMTDRCDKVAEIANANDEPFIAWCALNDESAMLKDKISGAVEICGSDSDAEKERKMLGFSDGSIRAIVTKPSIAGFGMNWQHCNRMSFFPSHSHEQFYQASRRCWRFGQKREVECHIVTTEAEVSVTKNMQRKERLADEMFDGIVSGMKRYQKESKKTTYQPTKKMEMPKW